MKGPRDMNCCKAKNKTKQKSNIRERAIIMGRLSYTYNIVRGAWLITDTLHSLLTVCVSMCFGVAEVEEKNNQHTRQSQRSRDTVQERQDRRKQNKKNQRELMFNHITRCPSPLWGDSQGSFTASSADLKSTSSLASMYSLSLCSTRQAISTLAALSFHLTKTAHTTMLCHFCLNAAYGHKKNLIMF